MANKTEFGKVYVELDGEKVCIQDLPKNEYEDFLDLMKKVRCMYIALSDY